MHTEQIASARHTYQEIIRHYPNTISKIYLIKLVTTGEKMDEQHITVSMSVTYVCIMEDIVKKYTKIAKITLEDCEQIITLEQWGKTGNNNANKMDND